MAPTIAATAATATSNAMFRQSLKNANDEVGSGPGMNHLRSTELELQPCTDTQCVATVTVAEGKTDKSA
jgi:hypothetical protein